jgi:hypothetical protein
MLAFTALVAADSHPGSHKFGLCRRPLVKWHREGRRGRNAAARISASASRPISSSRSTASIRRRYGQNAIGTTGGRFARNRPLRPHQLRGGLWRHEAHRAVCLPGNHRLWSARRSAFTPVPPSGRAGSARTPAGRRRALSIGGSRRCGASAGCQRTTRYGTPSRRRPSERETGPYASAAAPSRRQSPPPSQPTRSTEFSDRIRSSRSWT